MYSLNPFSMDAKHLSIIDVHHVKNNYYRVKSLFAVMVTGQEEFD